ncbi:MAG: hypothetical protein A2V85_17650 [Chloroflexi bacterium RBG_16_72_14]|nr:MAG: hypothetical protein A2V85_17650 [Chloroflexi bacterium RBG_16_72_14]
MSAAAGDRRPRIAVVADDLIWATRLVEGVRRAGAEPVAIRSAAAVEGGLAGVVGVVVDTTARAYDPIAVLRRAASLGIAAIAVAPHVDVEGRRAARAAGASRVHPYQVLFERGDRELAAWLSALGYPPPRGPEEDRA